MKATNKPTHQELTNGKMLKHLEIIMHTDFEYHFKKKEEDINNKDKTEEWRDYHFTYVTDYTMFGNTTYHGKMLPNTKSKQY